MDQLDDRMLEWASPVQADYFQAVKEHGSIRAGARAIGIDESTVRRSLHRLEKRAALKGYSPKHHDTRPVAPGQILRGSSKLYRRGEAEPVLEWVKTRADAEQIQQFLESAAAAMAEELPRAKKVKPPAETHEHLCNVYTLTDSHVGALCWHKEGGADWDLEIAEKTLVGCFDQMIRLSQPAKVGIIAQLGDFLHQDSISPVTPTSNHLLSADGRFQKIVQIAIKILRHSVQAALEKHERVVVILAEGNHDISSSIWLRAMFAALYENEPRVEVIDSPLPYYVYQHGETMLAWHHGHLKKMRNCHCYLQLSSQKFGATRQRGMHRVVIDTTSMRKSTLACL